MNALFRLLSGRHLGAALLLLLFAAPAPPDAAAAPPVEQVAGLRGARQARSAREGTPLPLASASALSGPPRALLADSWSWRTLYRPIESQLTSRGGLLRLGAVGMCIALFVIMCNKWNKW